MSHQTVSRYLRHGGEGVREALRDRISAAIAELDYRPNLAARAMRTQRTGRAAVLLPEGAAHSSVEVILGATETARRHQFDVDVLTLGGSPEARVRRARELLHSGLFEAVLSLASLNLTAPTPPGFIEYPLYDDEMHGVGRLADARALAEIVTELAAQGHRRFMHLAGAYSHASARERRDAYLRAVQEAGGESLAVIDCHWQPEAARDAVAALPSDTAVTAIVCANDQLAAAAIHGAAQRGWSVPHHLSVTGFDAHELGAWMTPSLTSVRIDHEALGRDAMAALIAGLRGEPAPAPTGGVMSVVWRTSTACPRTEPLP